MSAFHLEADTPCAQTTSAWCHLRTSRHPVEYVLAGGLIAFGPGHYEGYHGAAKYVDKILHGANPADLPIAGPTQFTMSANRTALAKLGLSLPSDLATQVSEWID